MLRLEFKTKMNNKTDEKEICCSILRHGNVKVKKEQSGWTASSECFNTELMYILTGFSAAMLTKYPFDS